MNEKNKSGVYTRCWLSSLIYFGQVLGEKNYGLRTRLLQLKKLQNEPQRLVLRGRRTEDNTPTA